MTVAVDAARTIGNLVFDNADYTLNGPASLSLATSTGTPTITVGDTGGPRVATIDATLVGSAGLNKAGNGKLTLTSPIAPGPVTVQAGTLEILETLGGGGGDYNWYGPGSTTVQSGAVLTINSHSALANLTLAGGELASSGVDPVYGYGSWSLQGDCLHRHWRRRFHHQRPAGRFQHPHQRLRRGNRIDPANHRQPEKRHAHQERPGPHDPRRPAHRHRQYPRQRRCSASLRPRRQPAFPPDHASAPPTRSPAMPMPRSPSTAPWTSTSPPPAWPMATLGLLINGTSFSTPGSLTFGTNFTVTTNLGAFIESPLRRLDTRSHRCQVGLHRRRRRPGIQRHRQHPTRPGSTPTSREKPTSPSSDESADPDGDGLTNGEEFAFASIRTAARPSDPITSQLNKTTGQFTYTRRASDAGRYLHGAGLPPCRPTDGSTWSKTRHHRIGFPPAISRDRHHDPQRPQATHRSQTLHPSPRHDS